MAHDITERLEVEKRLREQATRLRLLVSSANIGLWDWNLITNQVYFSPEWKRQIGYADDEILNRLEEWQDRVHPDDVERCVQKVSAYIANPQGLHELEFRLRHKDGSYRWMFAQADVLRDAAGKTVRMLGCHIDITERKQGEQALRMQAEQLRALSSRVQTAREEERKQVARDLHDQIGQILTVARMDVEWVSNHLPRDQIQVHARLQTTLDLIRDGIHTLRKICTELRPGVLDDLGLAAAIEWQAQEFAARANIACEVSVPAEDMALEPDHATAIFRIFQEALTNVARHAEATKVRASLAHRDGRLLLVVEDDGKGIRDSDLALAKGSLGLLGM
jgi:two-component system sensor histidine kinase UhpB